MGFLNRGHSHAAEAGPTETDPAPCIHATMAPRWENAADLGDPAKIIGYRCDGCRAQFSVAEGNVLRATEAERLKHRLFAR